MTQPKPEAPRPSFGPPADSVEPQLEAWSREVRAAPKLLFGAAVVDVLAGQLELDTEVLIRDGVIAAVGRGLSADGAQVIDLTGRYLLPGLIDLHAHPGLTTGLRTDPNGLSPERVERDLRAWLRYGVTTVQAMGTDRPFAFELRDRQRAGQFLGARLFTVGHGFATPGGVPPFQMDPPGPLRPTDPASASRAVQNLAERGASGVKFWYDDWYGQYPRMAPEIARAILEACHRHGLTSYAHVYRIDDAKQLIRIGLDVLAHLPRDRPADDELIELLLERATAVIPTLAVPETNYAYLTDPPWLDDPLFARLLPPGSVDFLRDERFLASIRSKPEFPYLEADLQRAKENLALLYRAGVSIVFGTDAGVSYRVVGFAEHRELELLAECGVRPIDALRMATCRSADLLGQGDRLGAVAAGRLADLLVLRDNPLLDLRATRTIESVWYEGVRVAGPI